MDTRFDIQSVKQRFDIIGNSPLINHAVGVAMQVAPTEMSVLIYGESGSGKESFSKIIHQLSPRKHGKFFVVNCGAIPEGTIDSELFGHEKGSFTGAFEARQGYFEVANGGTLFLDEIGELPLGTQARLLRVLENGEYIRVGSSKTLKTNVRVVAATNINLWDAVNRSKFRKDLFFRLSTVTIEVPALRERGEDIYLLFRKFVSDYSEKYRNEPIKLNEGAIQRLLTFRFPGNIRQLKNLAEQLSVLEQGKSISADVLNKYLPENQTNTLPAIYHENSSSEDISERDILYKFLFDMKKDMNDMKKVVYDLVKNKEIGDKILKDKENLFQDISETEVSYQENKVSTIPIEIENQIQDSPISDVSAENLSIAENEKELIIRALKKYKDRRNKAAKELGISERTLYRKLKEYDIE